MVRTREEAQSGDMTTLPPEAPSHGSDRDDVPGPDTGPRVTRDELRHVSRIRRTVHQDRKVAGVAGGLARYLDVDPVLLRVGFVVLAFFGGAGLLLYGALWLLLPEEGSDRAALNLDERSLVAALIGVGVLAALLLAGGSWDGMWFPWPLAVLGLILLLVVMNRNPGPRPPAVYTGPPESAPQPLAQPTAGQSQTPYTQPAAAAGYAPTAYAPQAYAPPAQTPPPYAPPAPAPRPRDPRKRGPILFWFTLALVALGIGVLGMVDVSGSDVPVSAYPAMATAVIGVMLLVGAFFGRAGGLILLGLLTGTALAGATVGEHLDTRQVTERPVLASAVDARYWSPAGEMVVDLTQVSDLEALTGREITVEGGVGRLVVIVPENVDVRASAHVNGPGRVEVLGNTGEGIDQKAFGRQNVPDEVARIVISAELGVGEIEIRTP